MPTNNETVTVNSDAYGEGDGPQLNMTKMVNSANIAEMLSQEMLDSYGRDAVAGYNQDKSSRTEWEQRNEKAMKLALQVQEAKNFPWENCSNVKFPLMTIAALQFLARISVMTKGRNIAKVEAMGQDPDGQKAQQAKRISRHLSFQLLEEDPNWIEKDEEAKFAASIVGASFKKSYYDSVLGVNISDHVPASNLVLDYYTKDIAKASRVTHLMSMSGNAIEERVRRGLWLPMTDVKPGSPGVNILKAAADEASGIRRPTDSQDSEFDILEQHCWMDLDGDGYKEPYIVYVRFDTMQVLRIVAKYFDQGDVHRKYDNEIRQLKEAMDGLQIEQGDYIPQLRALERELRKLEGKDNKVVSITPMQYWTRYLFLPSPDGGVYGLGFGPLLGPMTEAVSTLTNQLVDSGTMSNTAGGFLGRGVKMKGGKMSFDPFEWKPVDSTGDDLRKSIFPLPVREPSPVLFQLLGMLVSYSEKISGATDIMTGTSPGQNTPAETSRNTVEQGMMLFSGIYSRMYRSFREELIKMYKLNQLYFASSPKFRKHTQGEGAILGADDYRTGDFKLFPAASPEAVSTTQLRDKAKLLLDLAMGTPGFDKYEATLRFLEAHEIPDIESVYPDPKGPRAVAPPPNPKLEIEKAKLQLATQEHQDSMQVSVVQLKMDAELNQAKINELQAKAQKMLAEAQGVQTGHQIALINAQIGAAKHRQDGLLKSIDVMQKHSISTAKVENDAAKIAADAQSQAQPSNSEGSPE